MPSRSSPFRPEEPIVAELSAGGVIFHPRDSRILLLHEIMEDRWCLPKGHVERGESLLGAAEREIAEETGITRLRRLQDLGEVTYRFYDDRRRTNVLKVVTYFAYRARSERVRLEPLFDRAEWSVPAEVRGRVYSTERQVLKKALGALPALLRVRPQKKRRTP